MEIQKSDTGKTFADYRNIIRKLKSKLNNLQQENQLLSAQHQALENAKSSLPEQMLMPNQNNSFQIEGNQQLMDKFYNNAQQLGFTLEMIFRGADLESNGMITIDAFKIILQKMKLSLTPSEINKIAYIFDEDCSGSIYKKTFVQTLVTYGINSEIIDSDLWNVGQKTLIDFCTLLQQSRIEPEIAWIQIDPKKQGFIVADQLSNYFKVKVLFRNQILKQLEDKELPSFFIWILIRKIRQIEQPFQDFCRKLSVPFNNLIKMIIKIRIKFNKQQINFNSKLKSLSLIFSCVS